MSGKCNENSKGEPGRILRDANRGSQDLFAGALQRLGMFTGLSAGKPRPDEDAVEKWGRIVGRTLGFGFLILLAINLFSGTIF